MLQYLLVEPLILLLKYSFQKLTADMDSFDNVKDWSCINANGKKLFLIRYPKDVNIDILKSMQFNNSTRDDEIGRVELNSNGTVTEELIACQEKAAPSSLRSIVVAKGEKKSKKSKSESIVVSGIDKASVNIGKQFEGTISLHKSNKLLSGGTNREVDISKNIRPCYVKIPQQTGLKLASVFASNKSPGGTELQSSLTPQKEHKKKRKHDRERESTSVTEDVTSNNLEDSIKKKKKSKKSSKE